MTLWNVPLTLMPYHGSPYEAYALMLCLHRLAHAAERKDDRRRLPGDREERRFGHLRAHRAHVRQPSPAADTTLEKQVAEPAVRRHVEAVEVLDVFAELRIVLHDVAAQTELVGVQIGDAADDLPRVGKRGSVGTVAL